MSEKPQVLDVPVDAAKRREVLEAVAKKLETVLLRYHQELHVQYHWRIKNAVKLLRGKTWPTR